MQTPLLSGAGIIGTGIAVIAIEGLPWETNSLVAVVCHGADVAVIAWGGVVLVEAAFLGMAVVFRAGVRVVTVERQALRAGSICAGIPGRARVTIVAGKLIVQVQTSLEGVAGIVGARVGVVAVQGACGNAGSLLAVVTLGARVSIIALAVDELVLASDGRVAQVRGADIAVVTGEWFGP